MTYRERREAKAERLREWADKREAKADAAYDGVKAIADRIPLGQPILVGHHSERGARADQKRIGRGMDSFCEHNAKASDMRSRAGNIEAQARTAIYSDDADAIDRLREKIAKLEAEREHVKQRNAAYRREHKAELKAETNGYLRDQMMPFPSYAGTNLSGNISRLRKRLEQLEREQSQPRSADRLISARFAGTCADCDAVIERGQTIRYSRADGARCAPHCSAV